MTGNRRSIFGNLLSFSEIRIGHDLVVHDLSRRALFIIMDGIADRILCPVSTQCNIFRYRLVPVIRRTGLICFSEPPLESKVRFRRIIRFSSIKTIFIRLRINICPPLRVISHRTSRELEVAVKNKASRHLGSTGILTGMFLIGKPTKPGCSFHRSFRYITRQIAGNVISKCYVLSADQGTVIVIESQRILFSIVVEVETSPSCIVMTIWPSSSIIFIKPPIPSICKTTIGSILCFTGCRSISSLRITSDLIPVINITQVIILHVY